MRFQDSISLRISFRLEFLSGESAPTYDPTDADHSYNVKVMLLSAPPPEDLFEKTCHFADSGAYSRETLVHPTRVIQFLVGVRGKNETMAIGGPWYESLA